ncbi:MAG: 5'-nucleotidase C-terminal domain-containing protein, partial [Bacteroidia bacterium]|nr:5'-nucleotidase C-terminal domain-containing protein [Bacteroidia bacterium]
NDVLTTAFANGSFPLVSANLDMSGFPALQQWIQPSIIKNIAGVHIGIFGMTVPNNPTNMPDPVIVSDDIVNIAQQSADALLANGADVVICLSHLGFFYDQIVASSTTGINFIVGGHDHYLFQQPVMVNNQTGNPVPVFQAGEHYKYIGKLHFTVDNGTVIMNDYRIVNVDAAVPFEPSVQSVVEILKQGVIAQFGDIYHTVVGNAVSEATKKYDTNLPLRDTPLGNLVTDAFRQKTGTEIAITPLGLISEKIYQGLIVPADVFRSLSYGYDEATGLGLQLATFNITGAELVHGMEVGLSQLEVGDDFFLEYSGLKFKYDPTKPVGERVILNSIRINGKKLSPQKEYSCTVNTGVIMLLGLVGVTVTDVNILPDFEYDMVKDYIAQLGNINYHSQGRIIEEAGGGSRVEESENNSEINCELVSYYNSVSQKTEFRITVADEGMVTLKIFTAEGKEYSIVTNRLYQPGTYHLSWDSSALPSGIYFTQLLNEKNFVSGKLILMK